MDHDQIVEFIKEFGIAAGVIAAQIIFIAVLWIIFKRLEKRISSRDHRIKPLIIKKTHVLTSKQISRIIIVLLHAVKYFLTAFQLFLTVPIVFSIFPQTRELSGIIFALILTPLKKIGTGIVSYIPNLITIIIILILTKFALKALKFFADKIAKGRLKIPGFYTDWAYPSFSILRFLIYAFTFAIVFPYLPGSESRAFQGVSVFVGIVFSLGSSTAIGNLVAGFVITYMRPFKIGDRIQIQGYTGFVIEKHLMVIRIKTHKNEYITFPNMQVLSCSVTNYNTSLDENEEGLILHADITYNYATPWRLIHEVLIEAAHNTKHIQKHPKPFVLQTAIDDNYARYQINCYTKNIHLIPDIYTNLFENIQDGFASRGLDLTAPEFKIILPPESREPGPAAEGFRFPGFKK